MIDALASWYPGHRLLEFLVTLAAAATLVTAAAWAISFFLPRTPAARHGVLFSALMASLASPLFTLAFVASGRSLVSVPLLIADRATPAQLLADGARPNGAADGFDKQQRALPGRESAIDQRPVIANEGAVKDSRFVRDPTASATAPIRSAVVAAMLIWLCGTVVGMLALVRSVVALLRLRQSVQPLCDPAVDRTLAAARALLKTKRSTEIAVSNLARAPLAAGLMQPIVILPATLIESISPAQLREVLLYELAHIERRDNLVALAQLVARSLFWPIRFVHLLNRRLERRRRSLRQLRPRVQ